MIDLKMVPDAKPEGQRSLILLPGQTSPGHEETGSRVHSMPSGLLVPIEAVPVEKTEPRWVGQKLGVRHPDRTEIVARIVDVRGRGRTNDQRRELIRSALTERGPRLMKYKSALLLESDEVIEGPVVEQVRKVGRKDVEFTYQMWILVGPISIREMWILTPERRYMLRWTDFEFSIPVGEQRQFSAVLKFGLPTSGVARRAPQ